MDIENTQNTQNIENKKTLAGSCESCMMPFKKDKKGENRDSSKYCSYCFDNGELIYKGEDVNEFKRLMVEEMVRQGKSKWKAKLYAFMSGYATRWKGENSKLGKTFSEHAKSCEENKK